MTLTSLELQIWLISTGLLVVAILWRVIQFLIRTVAHIIGSMQKQPLIHRQTRPETVSTASPQDIFIVEEETVTLKTDTDQEIRITQDTVTHIEAITPNTAEENAQASAEEGAQGEGKDEGENTENEENDATKLSAKEQKRFDELRIDAITYKERGRLDLYEKTMIEALALDPQNLEITRMLGDHYFDTGKYIKALSLLKKVVNEDPTNHKAVWQIGQIYLNENQIETAKLLVEKAISLKDDNPKYYISLVEIYYQLGEIKEAIKALEKVIKLRPKNIEYLLGIATLHEENSEPSKAAYYYSKIIELDPMHDIAKNKLKTLHV